jgi:phosphate transport system substrate-binding protein
VNYWPEDATFAQLADDNVRLIFASRELKKEDSAVFSKLKIIPRVSKIAIDGVAIVLHKENKDSSLLMSQLEKILKGEITKWSQLSKNNTCGDIKIVFDNGNSSNLRYIVDKFGLDSTHIKKFYSAGGSDKLIDYVSNNKSSIGFIGVNWISDSDDSTTVSFKKQVRVAGLAADTLFAQKKEFYQPYQAYLSLGYYPLSRNLYIISREARVGLGTGLLAFVNGEVGQRIILKSGLVPANVPLRIVNVKKNISN